MNKIVRDSSAQEFLAAAGPLLYKDEPANSLMLGIAESLSVATDPAKEQALYIRLVNENNMTTTAALQTPPMNLILTYAKTEELATLAQYLDEAKVTFPGVVGPAQETETFARIWSSRINKKAALSIAQKIYKLENTILPSVNGSLRLAQNDDMDLATKWLVEFAKESLPPHEHKSFEEYQPYTARSLANKEIHFWCVNGHPVSVAYSGRPTLHGVSIRCVYTPKHLRGNGYASAVVGYLSQKMLDAGKKFCVLYTDLANPTSNKIYQNVGYREVCDSKYFVFAD